MSGQVPACLDKLFRKLARVSITGGILIIAEFPHLHAHLEGENVDSFKYIHKEGKSWSSALEQQDIKTWLV